MNIFFLISLRFPFHVIRVMCGAFTSSSITDCYLRQILLLFSYFSLSCYEIWRKVVTSHRTCIADQSAPFRFSYPSPVYSETISWSVFPSDSASLPVLLCACVWCTLSCGIPSRVWWSVHWWMLSAGGAAGFPFDVFVPLIG